MQKGINDLDARLAFDLSNKSVTMRLIPSSWLDTRCGVWGGPKCRMVARRTRSCSGGSDVIMLGSRSYIEVAKGLSGNKCAICGMSIR